MTLDSEAVAARLAQMTAPAPGDEQRAVVSAEGSPARPSPWLASYFGGGEAAAGVRVTESTALTASAVFACVRNLAEDAAKLPFIVYRNLDPRGKERLRGHPLYRLLHDEPNPEMSSFDFRQAVTACAALFGGGFAEIERSNSGVPLFLWPLEPWRVRTRRDPADNLYYEVDGGRARLAPADVLHIKGFGFDGVLGCMLSQVGKESLGLTLAAQRFAAGFFGNGTRLSGVFSHPGKLSPQAYERLKESVKEEHGGVQNAWKVKILEEGLKWGQTSALPNEAQMLETREFQVEDVARWFRMPPHKIQHLLRSTFSNIEHQGIEYVTDTLLPWLVRWEQESKRKLIDRSEPDVFAEHLVDGLLRGDAVSRSQALQIQLQNGALNVDEWRAMENRNPLPDGQGTVHFVPLNMTTIERAIAGPPEPPEVPPTKDAKVPPPAAPAIGATGGEKRDDAAIADAARRGAIVDAHRPALLDAAARVIRREVEVIRRKAKNPETLGESIRTFYAGHDEYVRNALRPVVTAYVRTLEAIASGAVDPEACVGHVAAQHLETASMRWADPVAGQVDSVLGDWEGRAALDLVAQVFAFTDPKEKQ